MTVANPFSRSPVASALFLVLTMVWLAGLFVLLHAFFIAAVQILVYAGAVMVLFLFVIMLLDLKEEERRTLEPVRGRRRRVSFTVGGAARRHPGRAI
jgi:NADH:ubiquinone oxidoreductase subunit 6 (subunit J)